MRSAEATRRASPQVPKNNKRTLTMASECAAPETIARCAACSAFSEAIPVGWIAMVRMPPSDPAMRAIPALRSSVMIDTLDIDRLPVKVYFAESPAIRDKDGAFVLE